MYSYQPDIFSEISESSTDDDIIDIILSELNRTQKQCHLFEKTYEHLDENRIFRIVNLLEHHNLAEKSGQSFQYKIPLKITQTGTNISNQGGWLSYNSKIKHKEDQEKILRQQEVESTVSSSKYQKLSMYISSLAFIVSSYFAYTQHNESSKQQHEIDILMAKVRPLDSLILSQKKLLEEKKSLPNSSYKNKFLKTKP